MSIELWLTFVLASTILVAIPGPTVVFVVSYAISGGRKTGFASVLGVFLGDLTAVTVSLAGAGAILAASATLFTILKLCGAVYLIWLGFKLWNKKPEHEHIEHHRQNDNWKIFRGAYLVTAFNPKGIIFFMAFVPQFITPDHSVLWQSVILGSTFVILGAVNAMLWVLLAASMRQVFYTPSAQTWMNRLSGSFLMGTGLWTALAQKSA